MFLYDVSISCGCLLNLLKTPLLDFQAPQPIEKNATQDTALLFTENGKPSVKHQPEVINKEAAETNHSEVKNGGLEAAGHGSDPGAIATQLVIEAAAAHEEAHKVLVVIDGCVEMWLRLRPLEFFA